MPKSKRAKVVHLTKVDKKGKELTLKLFSAVQESLDAHQYCFVFSIDNMRNTFLKQVRSDFPDSRLFYGKTKVMAKALGTTPETSHLPNTYQLSPHLHGSIGLLLTSRPAPEIISHFSSFAEMDFARAGTAAIRAFTIPAGLLYSRAGEVGAEDDVLMAHSIEPELRRLGVPSRLEKGKVMLDDDYEVCREGQVLDSRQTRLLKLFGVATAEFKVRLVAYWSAATHEVIEIDPELVEE